MDSIAVIIPTYNRSRVVRETISLLNRNICYSGKLSFYVGCDGDDDTPHVVNNLSLGDRLTCLNTPSGSLGANLNRLLLQAIDDGHDLFLQMDDDHHLLGRLDLDKHVRYLTDFERVGWIRLMGIGYHKYDASLQGEYWHVRWDSPELYITSMRPHLKHIRFLKFFGLYPEGLKLGRTEEGYCHICKDRVFDSEEEAPSVAIPIDVLTESLWDHVGESWQQVGK